MAPTCETDGCDKAAEMGKDRCPLCQHRSKGGDAEFNALTNRVND